MTRMTITGALLVALAATTAGAAPTDRGAARASWIAGKRAQGDERRRHFSAGVAAARSLLQADPDDPEGLLWLAANLGAEALERGKLVALRVLPEMERLLLRLEERHPQYDHAAAARTLGVLYHKAPALISIGSNARAREFFERALQRDGRYPPNLALAAEFFDDVGDEARARSLSRAYLAAPADESEHPDAPEWRKTAQQIAKEDR